MSKLPITLYHCPYCRYEAGRRSKTVEHMKEHEANECVFTPVTKEAEEELEVKEREMCQEKESGVKL